ncbi:hypothetical protein EAF04_001237 [Stromatinia cepivora]|nr:hypothetical protein EAF04_001237 [Stromatinia cepivora]
MSPTATSLDNEPADNSRAGAKGHCVGQKAKNQVVPEVPNFGGEIVSQTAFSGCIQNIRRSRFR